jgi:hypothetical protein
MNKRSHSKALLVGAVLGSLYAIYVVYYFFSNTASQTDAAAAIGAGIATALVMPHMFLTILAVIFNWIGWGLGLRWSALVAGILYAVAAVAFILYAPFVLLQMVLAFVGFANLKKLNARPQTV